jgi:hypothetical protein
MGEKLVDPKTGRPKKRFSSYLGKVRKVVIVRRDVHKPLPTDAQACPDEIPKKNVLVLSAAFPMFVPSLSWQNVRFYVSKRRKKHVFLTVS